MAETGQALTADEITLQRHLITLSRINKSTAGSYDFALIEKLLAVAEQHAALAERSDQEMLRVKACEHIADGDEGWERLRNECPSTAAVARLRDQHAEMLAVLRSVEWGTPRSSRDWCPCCHNTSAFGHEPDCTLSAAIQKAGG